MNATALSIDEMKTTPLDELRARGVNERDIEMIVEIRTEEAEFLARMPQPPACPSWCTLEPGHRYENDTPGDDGGIVYQRCHEGAKHEHARVSQMEENENGAIRFESLGIFVSSDVSRDHLTAEDAWEAGSGLINAALELRQIERAVTDEATK